MPIPVLCIDYSVTVVPPIEQKSTYRYGLMDSTLCSFLNSEKPLGLVHYETVKEAVAAASALGQARRRGHYNITICRRGSDLYLKAEAGGAL